MKRPERGMILMKETERKDCSENAGRLYGGRKKLIAGVALLTVIAVFIAWVFVPRSFEGITGVESTEGLRIGCSVQRDTFLEDYRFKELSTSRETGDVMSILTSSGYRKDIRYPFSNSAISTQAFDGRNMRLDFYDSAAERYICHIYLIDAGVLEAISYEDGGGEKSRTYVPTNSEMFDRLYEYLDDMAV